MAGSENNAGNKVKAISPLAQWRVKSLGVHDYRRSDGFMIGSWNWCLSVENNNSILSIRLISKPSCITEDKYPIAKILIRAHCTGSTNSHYAELYKKMFRAEKELIWRIERVHASCVTIDLEFLDLKISSTSNHVSIRPDDFLLLDHSIKNTLRNISCMFQESIHADVTIETSDGSLRAHKAVLASSSPVFKSMFLHDFKEKQSSIIKIEDMSTDACSALLAYMYGAIKQDDFLKHCLPLLAAADKYDLQDLRKCCEEILLEDINSSNVFEKLRTARRYKLDKLTKGCLAYLFDFRRLPDVRGKLKDFFYDADRKLLREVFEETVANWKCC